MVNTVIVLKGAATYGMMALGLDADQLINGEETPFKTREELIAVINSKLPELELKLKLNPVEKDETNYANFLILKKLAEMNPGAFFLSDRGEEKKNLKFATSNLGGLVRKYPDQKVADLGTGELKSSKTNMGKGDGDGDGLDKLSIKAASNKVDAVAQALKQSQITDVYYTGSWRDKVEGYNIEDLKKNAGKNRNDKDIHYVLLSQEAETELASEAWEGAVRAMMDAGKRGVYRSPPHSLFDSSVYNIKYHEHGNGSMQGNLVTASVSLTDLITTLRGADDKKQAFINWWGTNITVTGGGARKNRRSRRSRRSRRGQRQQKRNRRSRRGSRSRSRSSSRSLKGKRSRKSRKTRRNQSRQ
jgi:hypothetical protein